MTNKPAKEGSVDTPNDSLFTSAPSLSAWLQDQHSQKYSTSDTLNLSSGRLPPFCDRYGTPITIDIDAIKRTPPPPSNTTTHQSTSVSDLSTLPVHLLLTSLPQAQSVSSKSYLTSNSVTNSSQFSNSYRSSNVKCQDDERDSIKKFAKIKPNRQHSSVKNSDVSDTISSAQQSNQSRVGFTSTASNNRHSSNPSVVSSSSHHLPLPSMAATVSHLVDSGSFPFNSMSNIPSAGLEVIEDADLAAILTDTISSVSLAHSSAQSVQCQRPVSTATNGITSNNNVTVVGGRREASEQHNVGGVSIGQHTIDHIVNSSSSAAVASTGPTGGVDPHHHHLALTMTSNNNNGGGASSSLSTCKVYPVVTPFIPPPSDSCLPDVTSSNTNGNGTVMVSTSTGGSGGLHHSKQPALTSTVMQDMDIFSSGGSSLTVYAASAATSDMMTTFKHSTNQNMVILPPSTTASSSSTSYQPQTIQRPLQDGSNVDYLNSMDSSSTSSVHFTPHTSGRSRVARILPNHLLDSTQSGGGGVQTGGIKKQSIFLSTASTATTSSLNSTTTRCSEIQSINPIDISQLSHLSPTAIGPAFRICTNPVVSSTCSSATLPSFNRISSSSSVSNDASSTTAQNHQFLQFGGGSTTDYSVQKLMIPHQHAHIGGTSIIDVIRASSGHNGSQQQQQPSPYHSVNIEGTPIHDELVTTNLSRGVTGDFYAGPPSNASLNLNSSSGGVSSSSFEYVPTSFTSSTVSSKSSSIQQATPLWAGVADSIQRGVTNNHQHPILITTQQYFPNGLLTGGSEQKSSLQHQQSSQTGTTKSLTRHNISTGTTTDNPLSPPILIPSVAFPLLTSPSSASNNNNNNSVNGGGPAPLIMMKINSDFGNENHHSLGSSGFHHLSSSLKNGPPSSSSSHIGGKSSTNKISHPFLGLIDVMAASNPENRGGGLSSSGGGGGKHNKKHKSKKSKHHRKRSPSYHRDHNQRSSSEVIESTPKAKANPSLPPSAAPKKVTSECACQTDDLPSLDSSAALKTIDPRVPLMSSSVGKRPPPKLIPEVMSSPTTVSVGCEIGGVARPPEVDNGGKTSIVHLKNKESGTYDAKGVEECEKSLLSSSKSTSPPLLQPELNSEISHHRSSDGKSEVSRSRSSLFNRGTDTSTKLRHTAGSKLLSPLQIRTSPSSLLSQSSSDAAGSDMDEDNNLQGPPDLLSSSSTSSSTCFSSIAPNVFLSRGSESRFADNKDVGSIHHPTNTISNEDFCQQPTLIKVSSSVSSSTSQISTSSNSVFTRDFKLSKVEYVWTETTTSTPLSPSMFPNTSFASSPLPTTEDSKYHHPQQQQKSYHRPNFFPTLSTKDMQKLLEETSKSTSSRSSSHNTKASKRGGGRKKKQAQSSVASLAKSLPSENDSWNWMSTSKMCSPFSSTAPMMTFSKPSFPSPSCSSVSSNGSSVRSTTHLISPDACRLESEFLIVPGSVGGGGLGGGANGKRRVYVPCELPTTTTSNISSTKSASSVKPHQWKSKHKNVTDPVLLGYIEHLIHEFTRIHLFSTDDRNERRTINPIFTIRSFVHEHISLDTSINNPEVGDSENEDTHPSLIEIHHVGDDPIPVFTQTTGKVNNVVESSANSESSVLPNFTDDGTSCDNHLPLKKRHRQQPSTYDTSSLIHSPPLDSVLEDRKNIVIEEVDESDEDDENVTLDVKRRRQQHRKRRQKSTGSKRKHKDKDDCDSRSSRHSSSKKKHKKKHKRRKSKKRKVKDKDESCDDNSSENVDIHDVHLEQVLNSCDESNGDLIEDHASLECDGRDGEKLPVSEDHQMSEAESVGEDISSPPHMNEILVDERKVEKLILKVENLQSLKSMTPVGDTCEGNMGDCSLIPCAPAVGLENLEPTLNDTDAEVENESDNENSKLEYSKNCSEKNIEQASTPEIAEEKIDPTLVDGTKSQTSSERQHVVKELSDGDSLDTESIHDVNIEPSGDVLLNGDLLDKTQIHVNDDKTVLQSLSTMLNCVSEPTNAKKEEPVEKEEAIISLNPLTVHCPESGACTVLVEKLSPSLLSPRRKKRKVNRTGFPSVKKRRKKAESPEDCETPGEPTSCSEKVTQRKIKRPRQKQADSDSKMQLRKHKDAQPSKVSSIVEDQTESQELKETSENVKTDDIDRIKEIEENEESNAKNSSSTRQFQQMLLHQITQQRAHKESNFAISSNLNLFSRKKGLKCGLFCLDHKLEVHSSFKKTVLPNNPITSTSLKSPCLNVSQPTSASSQESPSINILPLPKFCGMHFLQHRNNGESTFNLPYDFWISRRGRGRGKDLINGDEKVQQQRRSRKVGGNGDLKNSGAGEHVTHGGHSVTWNYKKIKSNVYLTESVNATDHLVGDVHSICHCDEIRRRVGSISYLMGCGEDCINRMTYTECNSKSCPISYMCTNNVIQKRMWRYRLSRFMTEFKGWGVKTLDSVPLGQFILEYTGI